MLRTFGCFNHLWEGSPFRRGKHLLAAKAIRAHTEEFIKSLKREWLWHKLAAVMATAGSRQVQIAGST